MKKLTVITNVIVKEQCYLYHHAIPWFDVRCRNEHQINQEASLQQRKQSPLVDLIPIRRVCPGLNQAAVNQVFYSRPEIWCYCGRCPVEPPPPRIMGYLEGPKLAEEPYYGGRYRSRYHQPRYPPESTFRN